MIDFKKPIEIFRVNADATFELGKGVDPLVALGELSKAFMKQQERIKRLEEMYEGVIGEKPELLGSNVMGLLKRELNFAQKRIKRLEEAGDRMRLFCADPDDCFAWDRAKETKL